MTPTTKRVSIKTARILAGMTKDEACTTMKIRRPQLLAWENGCAVPSHDHAVAMAEAYGMPLDMISFRKEDNSEAIDNSALRARILDKFGSLDKFAQVIDMKPQTLRNKVNNKTRMNGEDICRMIRALDVQKSEIKELFFTTEDDTVRDTTAIVLTVIKKLTSEQTTLLLEIMDLVIGNPDRRKFALEWSGRMKDLPAALAQI